MLIMELLDDIFVDFASHVIQHDTYKVHKERYASQIKGPVKKSRIDARV